MSLYGKNAPVIVSKYTLEPSEDKQYYVLCWLGHETDISVPVGLLQRTPPFGSSSEAFDVAVTMHKLDLARDGTGCEAFDEIEWLAMHDAMMRNEQ